MILGAATVAADVRPNIVFFSRRRPRRRLVADEALGKPKVYNLAVDRAEADDLATRESERVAGMLARLRVHAGEIEADRPDGWRSEVWSRRKP